MIGIEPLLRVADFASATDFFFFKQKTAYEMCGRDWSSDVCSSDLVTPIATLSTATELICMSL